MDNEDIARFRANLAKHLQGDLSKEEKSKIAENKERAKTNVKRILSNCGGKNPILGY
ncbi:MAG: hypothetical protein HDS62_08610 [Bacteroidales bacterium]|nr:hypothetical protein [Bacteroidales bacterium]